MSFCSATRPERACSSTLERILDSQFEWPILHAEAPQPSPLRQPASGGCLDDWDVECAPAVDSILPIHVDDEADDEDDDSLGPDDSILVVEANRAAALKRRRLHSPTRE